MVRPYGYCSVTQSLEDIKIVSDAIVSADSLVRVIPIHKATNQYCSSETEIDIAIKNGADIVMLSFFKTTGEVEQFNLLTI